MKTSISVITPPPPAFTPVKLEITFESLEELRAFYNIFNHIGIARAVGEDVARKVNQTLLQADSEAYCPNSFRVFDMRLTKHFLDSPETTIPPRVAALRAKHAPFRPSAVTPSHETCPL